MEILGLTPFLLPVILLILIVAGLIIEIRYRRASRLPVQNLVLGVGIVVLLLLVILAVSPGIQGETGAGLVFMTSMAIIFIGLPIAFIAATIGLIISAYRRFGRRGRR